jgi:prophage tail gpP-like protein
MAQSADTGLKVRFERDGRVTKNVVEWEIESSYLVSTDGFSFTLFEQDRKLTEFLELQPVELIVNGVSQLVGRIDVTERGDSAYRVRCEGRDYIADIVESNIDPFKRVTAGSELGDAILDMVRICGIQTITDFENILMAELRTGKPIKHTKRKGKKSLKTDDLKPKYGEGIYEFCNRLVARFSATLQPSNVRSDIVIDSPDYTQEPSYSLRRTDDVTSSAGNNILRGRARRDYSSFPTHCIFTGSASAKGKTGQQLSKFFDMAVFAEGFGDELGRTIRDGISVGKNADGAPGVLTRLLTHRDEDSRTEDQLFAAASRAIAERLKDTLAYTCTVKGHTDPATGAIYSVNTMAQVDDSIAGVHEPLWIARRTLRYVEGSGAETELELWRPESFQIGSDE